MLASVGLFRQSPSGRFLQVPSKEDYGSFAYNSAGATSPLWNDGTAFRAVVPPGAGGAFNAAPDSGANWTVNASGVVTYIGTRSLTVFYKSLPTISFNETTLGNGVTMQLSKNGVGIGTFDFDQFSVVDAGGSHSNAAVRDWAHPEVSRPIVVVPGDTLQVIAYVYQPPNTATAFEWRTNIFPLWVNP